MSDSEDQMSDFEAEEEEVEAVLALGDGVAGVVLDEATMDDIGRIRNRYSIVVSEIPKGKRLERSVERPLRMKELPRGTRSRRKLQNLLRKASTKLLLFSVATV